MDENTRGVTAIGFIALMFGALLAYIAASSYWNAIYDLTSPVDTAWAVELVKFLLFTFAGLLGNPSGRLSGAKEVR